MKLSYFNEDCHLVKEVEEIFLIFFLFLAKAAKNRSGECEQSTKSVERKLLTSAWIIELDSIFVAKQMSKICLCYFLPNDFKKVIRSFQRCSTREFLGLFVILITVKVDACDRFYEANERLRQVTKGKRTMIRATVESIK